MTRTWAWLAKPATASSTIERVGVRVSAGQSRGGSALLRRAKWTGQVTGSATGQVRRALTEGEVRGLFSAPPPETETQ